MRNRNLPVRVILQALVVLVAAGIVSLPALVGAQRQEKDPSAERAAVRARKAQVASQVDGLKASDAQIAAALADLQANVEGQQARLAEAERAAAEAQEAVEDARAAVAAKQAEIDQLRAQIREFAVDAFIHPPADDAMQALQADDPSESAEKRALLELQNESDADLLDRLSAAEEDLAVKQREAEAAKQAADEKQAAVEERLAEVTAARDQQAAFGAQVQARLDRALAEAANLESIDKALSAKIRRQQAELARQAAAALAARQAAEAAEAAEAAAASTSDGGGGGGGGGDAGGGGSVSGPVNVGPGPGGLSTVSCPSGGSITVASSIAGGLASMLKAAASAGVSLCGGGYRDPQAQIAVRQSNCGTSYYAIYQMPSSQCSPPTAPPGTSMHERGLAIDFANCSSRGSACFQWLAANAGGYGFQNLPAEPWHWSTNGN